MHKLQSICLIISCISIIESASAMEKEKSSRPAGPLLKPLFGNLFEGIKKRPNPQILKSEHSAKKKDLEATKEEKETIANKMPKLLDESAKFAEEASKSKDEAVSLQTQSNYHKKNAYLHGGATVVLGTISFLTGGTSTAVFGADLTEGALTAYHGTQAVKCSVLSSNAEIQSKLCMTKLSEIQAQVEQYNNKNIELDIKEKKTSFEVKQLEQKILLTDKMGGFYKSPEKLIFQIQNQIPNYTIMGGCVDANYVAQELSTGKPVIPSNTNDDQAVYVNNDKPFVVRFRDDIRPTAPLEKSSQHLNDKITNLPQSTEQKAIGRSDLSNQEAPLAEQVKDTDFLSRIIVPFPLSQSDAEKIEHHRDERVPSERHVEIKEPCSSELLEKYTSSQDVTLLSLGDEILLENKLEKPKKTISNKIEHPTNTISSLPSVERKINHIESICLSLEDILQLHRDVHSLVNMHQQLTQEVRLKMTHLGKDF